VLSDVRGEKLIIAKTAVNQLTTGLDNADSKMSIYE
jgi:hypothetical protein